MTIKKAKTVEILTRKKRVRNYIQALVTPEKLASAKARRDAISTDLTWEDVIDAGLEFLEKTKQKLLKNEKKKSG